MKKPVTLLISFLGPALATQGAVLTFDGINTLIPDGTGGLADTRTVTAAEVSGILTGISVRLTVSGGGTGGAYNGDLYAFLRHESGAFVVLLNRPGKTALDPWGYGDNGLGVTFDDSGDDVHSYQAGGPPAGPLGGTWAPDGRSADPAIVTEASARDTSFSSFLGISPVGDWTLFIADVEKGGLARLDAWGLDLKTTLVPEPGTVALGSALGLAGFALVERRRRRPGPAL